MDTVILSQRYQVVIPRRIRDRMKLQPGEKFQVIMLNDQIELIPIRPMREMRGFLEGLDSSFEREREDRT